MQIQKSFLATAAAAVMALTFTSAAHANYNFSGSGPSGTLVSASETWSFNFDGGVLLNDWGSPGVGAGVVPYGESLPAYGMTLTFTGGGTINPNSVNIGNAAACVGSTYGGTTFCTLGPTDIWSAAITGPSSISFIAQNSTFFLSQGQDYFVNVFFDGATPTGFTGTWLTSYAGPPEGGGVPEPAVWTMMALGLGAMGASLRRSRRTAAAAA